ncbi:DUF2796 domain-containing protein [Undibacterium seohonense]|uniref:DUF2796 domain-containing protein n=1 Tax=Undibacterium seohonense TaxID=1344950 RepID=A0ABR6X3T4_9BURK|nr:DUF2796 domain-containing protein [Undibacterium seohonense]MBC3807446.1 DUF2796 domain-containing protein [Undibacterium seohonense]
MKKILFALIVGILALSHAPSFAQQKSSLHAHVHGQAQLQLAIDESQAVLSFSSPLDNFLGFERAPKDEAEQEKVKQLLLQLQNPLLWIELSPAAQCQAGQIKLDSPVITGKQKTNDEKKHGDLRFDLELQCKNPQHLRSLKAKLLQQYKGIHRLKVEVVHAGGQHAKTLQADEINMTW